MEWIIDDISEVLAVTDVKNILTSISTKAKGKIRLSIFMKLFWQNMTPKPGKERRLLHSRASRFIHSRSLHNILKEYFNRADGFANDTVTVLTLPQEHLPFWLRLQIGSRRIYF